MIIIRNEREVDHIAAAGRLVAACHRALREVIRPGITTIEVDDFVDNFLCEHGATAEQKGYKGYPYATCTSVNDQICHAFPSQRRLHQGDIICVDFVANLNGWLADSAWSYAVGKVQ